MTWFWFIDNNFSGSGSFGDVYEGQLDETIVDENNWENIVNNKVAVKFLRKKETIKEFLKEALVVYQLKHESEHYCKTMGKHVFERNRLCEAIVNDN